MNFNFFLVFVLIFSVIKAQKSLSLKEAIEIGLKNDLTLKNSQLDIEKTKFINKQVEGLLYPQISASGNFIYNYIIPTSLIRSFNPTAGPNDLIEVQFGLNYNFLGQIEATQLIFEPSVFVGLKARETLVELSTKNVQRTELELKATITKAYYTVVIAKKRLVLLEENIKLLKQNKFNTEQLYKNGFVEKIDVEKLTLSLNSLETQKKKVLQLNNLSENLFKFQLSLNLSEQIILTDSISESDILATQLLLNEEAKIENTIDYAMLLSTIKLKELELKRYQLSFLPTVAAFANYGYNGPTNNFNNVTFFKQGTVGLGAKVPIFSGFTNSSKIGESKIEVTKIKNSFELQKKQFELANYTLKVNLTNALDSYEMEKENVKLAEKIYKQTQKKYEIGTGSTLEVLNAYKDLVESQTNYNNALFEIIINKTDYLKNLNKL